MSHIDSTYTQFPCFSIMIYMNINEKLQKNYEKWKKKFFSLLVCYAEKGCGLVERLN